MCPLWAVLALGWLPLSLAVDVEPQLASITFATNNPTLTTITLEKPFCMFNASNQHNVSYEVHLYVMVNSARGGSHTSLPSCRMMGEAAVHSLSAVYMPWSCVLLGLCLAQPVLLPLPLPKVTSRKWLLSTLKVLIPTLTVDLPLGSCLSGSVWRAVVQDNRSFPINSTFQETVGGQRAPYKAASFLLPQCADPPDLNEAGDPSKADEILRAYLVRVGNDTYCLLDPNFKGTCNPPLTRATAYRFKYVLVNTLSGFVEDQTLWSRPIRTNQISPPSDIDLWPGRRSGAMIVITSILSTLTFFLLVGFAAAAVFSFVSLGSPDLEMQHESQISQEAVARAQGTQEPSYASGNRRQSVDPAEVYASKLQG